MLTPSIAGAILVALPLVIAARVLLRRQPAAIFWFAVALIGVGLGYLMATGATERIALGTFPDYFKTVR
jgi:hypothetical protein